MSREVSYTHMQQRTIKSRMSIVSAVADGTMEGGVALDTIIETGETALSEWAAALVTTTAAATAYIDSLDIKSMEQNDLVDLLSSMILTMYDTENADDYLLDYLLEAFDALRPAFAREASMATIIVALPLMNLTAVSYVWLRKGIALETVILDCNEWLSPYEVDITMSYIVRIYLRENRDEPYDINYNPAREGDLSDLLSAQSIGVMMDVATSRGNDAMWNWMRPFFGVNSAIVPPGPWMLETLPPRIPPLPRAWIEVPPGIIDEALMEQLKLNIPDASLVRVEGMVMGDVRMTSATLKENVYGIKDDRFSSVEEEMELFRIYGPSNPFFIVGPLTDEARAEADEDYPPGSDRMFLCDLYNYDDEDEVVTPIYTGICDWNGSRIADERSALRRPVRSGGWMNSYSSFEHMKEQIEDSRSQDDGVDENLAMVETMEALVRQWGLYMNIEINGSLAFPRCQASCGDSHCHHGTDVQREDNGASSSH